MADLRIPNLNKNSSKFLFKNKLSLRRKSKGKLIKESFIMLSFCVLILYFNNLIPNKKLIFNNFIGNLTKLMENILDSLSYIYEIGLAIFIMVSFILALILILGSFSRILKIARRKTREINLK